MNTTCWIDERLALGAPPVPDPGPEPVPVEPEPALLEPPHPLKAMPKARRLPKSQQFNPTLQQDKRNMKMSPNSGNELDAERSRKICMDSTGDLHEQSLELAITALRPSSGDYIVGTHHVVVFVLKHVAVENVSPGKTFKRN